MKPVLQKFIDHIQILQSKGNEHFPEGIFPAFRSNPIIGYRRPDTTVFFSAIICFTLQSVRKQADSKMQKQIDCICARAINNYLLFQNKDGLKTYNFWKTKPSMHFPNGYIFRHFDHFRIPDDIDDTAFIYLTTDPTAEELKWLKLKLSLHANGSERRIQNTYPEYSTLQAYSTWFGKNMYTEFDVCVLSNLMLLIFRHKLPLNEHDYDSLAYIRSVIETDRYRHAPFRCAHQYPRTPLIIYHVSRLIAAFDPPALHSIKQKLTKDAIQLAAATENPMDRVILATSLMRLGVKTDRISVEIYTKQDFRGFYFFIAGLLTAYENPLLYRISIHPLFHMHWICEAHCWTLLAEYETVWNNFHAEKPCSNNIH